MTGCYLVDYSYTETESLKPGYERDNRVYDVNSQRSVKEWIYSEEVSPTRVRLQHVLFGVGLDGKFEEGSLLRHQAEDWEYDAPFLYEFIGPANWVTKALAQAGGQWTRKITNLDDGLRYQCASSWSDNREHAEWACENYAPIPGRETRDMGRKDYQALKRKTRLVLYGQSWLERQSNIKTIQPHVEDQPVPLAKEVGKTWYVRIADSKCGEAQSFAQQRDPFWQLLRETWDGVLIGDRPFVEKPGTSPARYQKLADLEDSYLSKDLTDTGVRAAAKKEILRIINEYRAN
ncbi:MAG: hypothetical protein C5B49_14545 [Bdellovibrio sp.]|nr:MAG: hypothetical protein C5B49_14545 [Bdellovibrio sp.]